MTIQEYERYLPTAFDDSMTLLQKMNKVIEQMNKMGLLTNELVSKWNEVMEWIMGEGLTDAVSDKLDEMVADGTLGALINQKLFDRINWVDVVEDFGADPTGLTDSSVAIQNAVNFAKNLIVQNKFTKVAQVRIKGGTYRVNSQIVWSQFVKLKTMGTVVIESYVAGDSALWFTPEAGDPTFTDIMNKQQWFRSPFINASDGGIIIVNKLARTSGSTGIELGSRVDLGGKPFSRMSACDVACENFNVAVKFNAFNNYIGSFERFHLELNNTCVTFGKTGENVVNSGENIHFSDSVFAIADACFTWYCDGFDLRLVNCSMDFVQRVFYMTRGWRNIAVFGGHIENIGERYLDTEKNGGIVVFDVSNANDSAVHVSINGTSCLVDRSILFKVSIAGKLRVALENFHYRSVDTNSDAQVAFLFDDNTIVDKKHMFYQGEGILPAKSVNQISNYNFASTADSVGDDGIMTNMPAGFTVVREYPVIAKIVSTEGLFGGKAVQYMGSDNLGYIKLTTNEFRPVKAGQTVIATAGIKMTDISKGEVKTRVNFYDAGDRLIQTGSLIANKTGFKNDVWNIPTKPTSAIAPAGASKYKVEFVMSGCNGTIGHMSALFATVVE